LATIEPIKVIRYDNNSETIINEFEAKQLLSGYGLDVPDGGLVNSIDGALAFAKKIKYPVTVKVSGSSSVHKSDMGGVRLNINNAEMLTSAVNDLLFIEPELLVESMLDGAIAELIIGANFDPLFGSYLVIGSGGVLVELMNDSAALLFPITRQDILRALSELQISPILGGYRGKPSGDIDAIVDAVMVVAKFVKDNQVIELDVNPLLVFPQGKGATAVDILIKLNDEKT
jgi:acetyl-CoA synthetase